MTRWGCVSSSRRHSRAPASGPRVQRTARGTVAFLLASAGIEVVSAEDGVQALQVFYAKRPDLVLMDLRMPRMNGYVACRVIKEDLQVGHGPVLILTAHDSFE